VVLCSRLGPPFVPGTEERLGASTINARPQWVAGVFTALALSVRVQALSSRVCAKVRNPQVSPETDKRENRGSSSPAMAADCAGAGFFFFRTKSPGLLSQFLAIIGAIMVGVGPTVSPQMREAFRAAPCLPPVHVQRGQVRSTYTVTLAMSALSVPVK